MKKIFEKQYNLLFIASAAMFLQFLSSLICLYLQVAYDSFVDWSDYVYMAYCLAICGILAFAVIIKQNENKDNIAVKMWFAGFFLYAFCELLFYIKIKYMMFTGYSLFTDSIFNLWDNQHLYRLYISIAVIFLTYCVIFVQEKKNLYAGFAGVNLFLFGLIIFIMPDAEFLLLGGDESIFEVMFVDIIREAGILMLTINIFIFAMYKFYND